LDPIYRGLGNTLGLGRSLLPGTNDTATNIFTGNVLSQGEKNQAAKDLIVTFVSMGQSLIRTPTTAVTNSGIKQGIYEFPDAASNNIPYIGQSSNIPVRLNQHINSGRLNSGTESISEILGGKTVREIAEHSRIQQLTGNVPARFSPRVSNKVDPIGPKRQHLLE